MTTKQQLQDAITQSQSRSDLWQTFIIEKSIQTMAEVGVYRGDFAVEILKQCPAVNKYYMIDPWRHLADWPKPANKRDTVFEDIFNEAMSRTDFAAEKRIVLRGKTAEVVESIPDNSLDFVYIDGDHTLRGITIDLLRLYPKIRPGGWIGGDDFSPTIWQHTTDYEPTLVFPFAIYFAEAAGDTIYALPFDQFLIEKQTDSSFSFVDLTGLYSEIGLKKQLELNRVLGMKVREIPGLPIKLLKRIKNTLTG